MEDYVFISFSFDDQEITDKICKKLTKYKVNYWICTKDILAGENYRECIDKAIKDCKCVIFIQSDNSCQSSEVSSELSLAKNYNKNILPVKIDLSEPIHEFNYILAGLNYVDLTDESNFEINIYKLAKAINPSLQINNDNNEKKLEKKRDRKKRLTTIAKLLIALGISFFLFLTVITVAVIIYTFPLNDSHSAAENYSDSKISYDEKTQNTESKASLTEEKTQEEESTEITPKADTVTETEDVQNISEPQQNKDETNIKDETVSASEESEPETLKTEEPAQNTEAETEQNTLSANEEKSAESEDEKKYNEAIKLYEQGKYEEAIMIFRRLHGYSDSEEQIEKCKDGIKLDEYNKAVELKKSGQYYEAYLAFEALGDFKDCEEQKKNAIADQFLYCNVNDTVILGRYEQDGDTNNGTELIEWQVLDVELDRVLIISKYILDYMAYIKDVSKTTWADSLPREWLNNTFINEAFSDYEKTLINESTVPADKNPNWAADPTNSTVDKIFLLSTNEFNNYFAEESSAVCTNIRSVVNKANGKESWWLRTLYSSGYCYCIGKYGYISDYYRCYTCGIRPAMWIKID